MHNINKKLVLDVINHRFPNPKLYLNRLIDWMKLVGLENEDPNTVYNRKRICSAHFSINCTSSGTKRLNVNSYPTINIPGK